MTAGVADTDLATRFRRLIERHGPIPVARYMGESNARYYTSRDPLGAGGDFTTAPEISQMFGEMVGLWCADLWLRAGKPNVAYAELGPGRGTLARDALRVMAKQGLTPPVHFVEGSAALRQAQSGAVAAAQFHDTLDTLPDNQPLLLVANEFLDALPIRQLVMTEQGWRERMVALDADGERFIFAAGPSPMDDAVPADQRQQPVGTVIETCPGAAAIIAALSARLAAQGGAALFIDYGFCQPQTGETLQALRAHEKVGVFSAPGEMDLTAHVDFGTLAQIARDAGVVVDLATQGQWLSAMGIGMRAQSLCNAAPARAPEIAEAHNRLVDADQMGDLFKVMALRAPSWPPVAGFPA